MLRLHGKAAQELSRPFTGTQLRQNILRPFQRDGELVIRLLHFLIRYIGRAVIRHCGSLDNNVHLICPVGDSRIHVLSRDNVYHLHIAWAGQRCGTGDKGDLCPAAAGSLGDRIAHPAGGVIGQIADRIQRFPGRAGSDQHPLANHVLAVRQLMEADLQQLLRLRQLALPHRTAGQPAGSRLYDLPAVAAKCGNIVLGHRVFVHFGVHSRRSCLRAVTGQNGGRQHIVRQAVRQLSQHVGSRRSDQDKIRPVGNGDVGYTVLETAVKGVYQYLVAGELFKGDGRDEPGGIFRHKHLYIGMLLHQCRGQRGSLITGDAPCHAQDNRLSTKHI